ncbi:MAG: ATP-binding protein [Sulfuricurvum sp.]|nr:ATP-binding protein [Sulfuricurvum sp.]
MKNNIFSKEVEALYRALPVPLIATFFNALIIAFILKDQLPTNHLMVWISLNFLILAFRLTSYLRYRSSIPLTSLNLAYQIYMAGIIGSGIIWGSTVFYLLPDSSIHMMMLIIIVGGMVAGGVGSSSYRPESYIFYNLFVITPYALHFMLDKTNDASWMVGTALVLFAIMMIISSKKFHASFTEVVLLQLHQEELVDHLKEEKLYTQHLNDNLLQEIIEKEKYQTELITALEEARQAAIAKEAFFATMSHELRTPLNSIIGFSQILSRKKELPAEIITYLEKILFSGRHLLDLVNTILDYSKLKSGKMEPNFTQFSLRDFIFELRMMCEPIAHKRDIEIFYPTFENETIVADRKMLYQILLNILSNAIKFSPKNDRIKFTYDFSSEHLFTICDHGPGIALNMHEKIFDPFTQIDNLTGRNPQGTGLGLAIVKEMIDVHHGKIWVESVLGKGSCFYISLPPLSPST